MALGTNLGGHYPSVRQVKYKISPSTPETLPANMYGLTTGLYSVNVSMYDSNVYVVDLLSILMFVAWNL